MTSKIRLLLYRLGDDCNSIGWSCHARCGHGENVRCGDCSTRLALKLAQKIREYFWMIWTLSTSLHWISRGIRYRGREGSYLLLRRKFTAKRICV